MSLAHLPATQAKQIYDVMKRRPVKAGEKLAQLSREHQAMVEVVSEAHSGFPHPLAPILGVLDLADRARVFL